MKIKIAPVLNPLTGETVGAVEVYDPRVLPARPARAAVVTDPANHIAPQDAVPAYGGTVSLIVRFYDSVGSTVGNPIRNDRTALTDAQYTQWSQWPNGIEDDAVFFADCIITNLGLTKAA